MDNVDPPELTGDVAQVVERMLSMHEARGSIPRFSNSVLSGVKRIIGKGKVKVGSGQGWVRYPKGYEQKMNLYRSSCQ